MNIQEHIESGILEQYSLGALNVHQRADVLKNCALYPEIKQELAAIEIALEKFANSYSILPDHKLKGQILNQLGFTNTIDLENLPIVDAYSNYTDWLTAVEHLIPNEPFEPFFAAVLRNDEKVAQTLVITQLGVPDETHKNLIESFFILKGQCTCTVGNDVFTLKAGDFLEIPLHVNHDIEIQSPYVIAILQEVFV